MSPKVIIIGGGIAGLAAAYEYVKASARAPTPSSSPDVWIIEKSSRLGGRVHTIHDRDHGLSYEAGAGRISSTHKLVLTLIAELGLQLDPIHSMYEYKSNGVPIVIRSRKMYNELIKHVLSTAAIYDRPQLQSMTFGELCRKILGASRAKLVQSIFGYNAEFDLTNAYDGLQMFHRDFQGGVKYFHVRGGMDKIIDELHKRLVASKRVRIIMEASVTKVDVTDPSNIAITIDKASGKKFIVHGVRGAHVICALPQAALVSLFPEHKTILNAVAPVALNRAYGYVNNPDWLAKCPITTTDGHIRQFIPIDTRQSRDGGTGLAMVSYTDTRDAEYWHRRAGSAALMESKLSDLFSLSPGFPGINNVQHYYWEAGVHVWRPKRDSTTLSDRIMFLKGPDVPLYIIGEAYSTHQAWIEGALETAMRVVAQLTALNVRGGGGNTRTMLTAKDLQTMRKNKRTYVLLDDMHGNGRKLVIDVTDWQAIHPGGSEPLMRNAYKNITKEFNSVGFHFENSALKPSVQNALKKYMRGYY